MLDPNFDPLSELERLKINQQTIFNNQQVIEHDLRAMLNMIRAQDEIIKTLTKSIEVMNQSHAQSLMLWANNLQGNHDGKANDNH